jgi:hypothetical protein
MGFEVTTKLHADDSNGVYISKVLTGAPAAQAGLKKDDQLVSIAGRSIEDVFDVPGAFFLRGQINLPQWKFIGAKSYSNSPLRRCLAQRRNQSLWWSQKMPQLQVNQPSRHLTAKTC